MERLNRLSPDPASGSAAELLADLRFGDLAPSSRPYVVANMVSTVDGRARLDGRSGAIGGPADRDVFHQLRAQVDAVNAGTVTLATENYGRIIKASELRDQRTRDGFDADALAVVISRSGAIPWQIPLFAEPEQRVVIYASAAVSAPTDCGADVTISELDAEELAPAAVLSRLRSEHGVRSLLCEGGPRFLASLIEAGVLDELWLALGPTVAAGPRDEKRILDGSALDPARALEVASVFESASTLFVRYRTGNT